MPAKSTSEYYLHSPRKDTHLFNSIVSDALSKLKMHYKISTSVDYDSTSSGPKIQEGSTKIINLRTSESEAEGEVTHEIGNGGKKKGTIDDRHRMRRDMLQLIHKINKNLINLNAGVLEIDSTSYDNFRLLRRLKAKRDEKMAKK